MGYVITGIVCFVLGSLSSFICLSLCVAAGDNSRQEENLCNGCFGAANNDCQNCPYMAKEGDKDADKRRIY